MSDAALAQPKGTENPGLFSPDTEASAPSEEVPVVSEPEVSELISFDDSTPTETAKDEILIPEKVTPAAEAEPEITSDTPEPESQTAPAEATPESEPESALQTPELVIRQASEEPTQPAEGATKQEPEEPSPADDTAVVTSSEEAPAAEPIQSEATVADTTPDETPEVTEAQEVDKPETDAPVANGTSTPEPEPVTNGGGKEKPPKRGGGMSTVAELADLERLQSILADLRSDAAGVARTAWVILGHVDNSPNQIDILGEDTGNEASLDGFREHLADDQVMYGIIRITSTVDMSCTVKFVYVHWIGEEIPFAKRGRLGVVHGSVEQHFNPYHLLIETGNVEDLSEESIVQRLDESSGTKNNIIEGSVEGRQNRGFLQHQSKTAGSGQFKSVAPEGVAIETAPELQGAIGEVRDDKCETTWVLAGYEGGNVKGPLVLVEKGNGDVTDLVEQLIDDQVMYALYRIKDRIDDIDTVKFAYIYWIGPDTKPITKGKVSACTGPVEKVFAPVHVSLAFTNRFDMEEDVIRDKVMSSSGSKSHVM